MDWQILACTISNTNIHSLEKKKTMQDMIADCLILVNIASNHSFMDTDLDQFSFNVPNRNARQNKKSRWHVSPNWS